MGRRGPPRTPTALLAARGSRLAPRRANEPQAGRGVPTMPADLAGHAKLIWRELAPALDAMGVLSTNDGAALGRYCQTLADWRRLNRLIQRKGFTFSTRTTAGHPTIKTRPEVSVRKGLAADLSKLEAQFGMTPAARAGLDVTAIFTPGRKTTQPPTPPPAPPSPETPGPTPPANVIQGKDRFFKGPA